MCHGDLTPMSHVARKEPYDHSFLEAYYTDFAVTNTCRNFGKIYDWALASNVTSRPIEKHPDINPWLAFEMEAAKKQGVDLETQEPLGWLDMD